MQASTCVRVWCEVRRGAGPYLRHPRHPPPCGACRLFNPVDTLLRDISRVRTPARRCFLRST